jgi:hypothetical protein
MKQNNNNNNNNKKKKKKKPSEAPSNRIFIINWVEVAA